MRILGFVSEYPRIHGAQRSFLHLLRNLPARGVHPVVVMPGEGACVDFYRDAGLDVRVLPGSGVLQSFGTGLLAMPGHRKAAALLRDVIPYGLELVRFAKRERLDLVHCMTIRSALAAGIVPAASGIPVVTHMRGVLAAFGPAQRAAVGLVSTRIISVAGNIVDDLPRFARSKCVTIYNAIDDSAVVGADASADVRRRLGLAPDDVMLVMIGAVTPTKGQHQLLEALAIARPRLGGRRLVTVIVGTASSPEYQRHLERLVTSNHLADVRFVPWTDNPFAYHRAADFLVLASTTRDEVVTAEGTLHARSGEGLPRTIMEAMYLGRPVVAYDMAGVVEMVDHGVTGLVVKEHDRQGLADAIVRLATSRTEREAMGERAAVVARERFSTARMVDATIDVYRDAIAARRGVRGLGLQ